MRSRRFTLADQQAFAALSGDHNPLHLDPVASRRLLVGGVTVHGVHLLLWSLDQLVADGAAIPSLLSVRAFFDRAVHVGDRVTLTCAESDGRLMVRLTGEADTVARFNLRIGNPAAGEWHGVTNMPDLVCEEHDIASLSASEGKLDLVLPSSWREMFPHLAEFPPAQIALLLATTRLVGMRCPGLHSVYSELRLAFEPGLAPTDLHYRVVRADPRVRLVDIELSASGVAGSISAMARPKPYTQPSLIDVQSAVAPTEFANQRALVIGGSRGLGELAAKLLAAGGAHVTISYLTGKDEAAAIVAEAAGLGLSMETIRFDVGEPPEDAPTEGDRFTHLYFFATPHIPVGRPDGFASTTFARLADVYAAGLARTVEWFLARAVPAACVWYPSTILLEQPDPAFFEYIAAKACGEALCAHLVDRIAPVRVVVERLPRLPTDQTQAFTALQLADGVTTLREALLRCG